MTAGGALLLGAAIGLAWAAAQRPLSTAQATLFFPPALVLTAPPSEATPEASATPIARKETADPVAWASGVLSSKEAVEMICKRVDRSQSPDKAAALKSAVLLGEPGRVTVETLPDSCVRLQVRAQSGPVAVELCEGLLAYLTYKTKIPLEDPDTAELNKVEQQLRTQEKALGQTFYKQLGVSGRREGAEATLMMDTAEYQQNVNRYRPLFRRHYLRETEAAAAGPFFSILEPPAVSSQQRPWLESSLLGAGLGWLILVGLPKLRQRKPQERAWVARTRVADAADL